jgi:hypothetical protein
MANIIRPACCTNCETVTPREVDLVNLVSGEKNLVNWALIGPAGTGAFIHSEEAEISAPAEEYLLCFDCLSAATSEEEVDEWED